jgi:HlyD family secretion protein
MAGLRSMAAAAGGAMMLALTSVASPVSADAPKDIGATGTIEPRGGVVLVSGVPGTMILSIRAHVGQVVKKGDELMVLDDKDAQTDTHLSLLALQETRRHADQAVADEGVAVKLAADRADRAAKEAQSYRELGPNATSQHQLALVEAAAEDARAALEIERRKEVQIHADTASDLSGATKRYNLLKAKLSNYRVVAPANGVVLQVSQHVGEMLTGTPSIQIGDLSAMYVICDAFQGDLLKIKPGMRASASSNAFTGSLTGQVEWVGRLIQTKSQTGQFRIKLDDPALASRLVGIEVNVKVQP